MAHKLFSHRPGLDGIRGGGMIVFMLWHVGAFTALQGLWVFMNVFFVLSAFLITRLLLAEHRTFGNISVREFYVRRVRRLGPALLIMLLAVTVDGVFFAPATETRYLRGDILGTLGYVMNWRLVFRSDQYFEGFTHPSITRHAWSLSVEEQFYLFIPLLLIAVMWFLRSRLSRTAVFLVLAGVSAAWSASLNLSTQSGQAHAYYGTDVRVQALALGVAAGVWTAHVGRGSTLLKAHDRRDPLDQGRGLIEVVGWVGFAATLTAFAMIPPLAPWMFSRGGMMLTTLAGVAWVIGCAQRQPTALVRLHSFRPIVYTGRLSYGLYLYHWPIFLWLKRAFPTTGLWPLALATLVLTYAVAVLSYRYIEYPIMKHGWRAYGRRRMTALKAASGASVAAIVAGALAVTGGAASVAQPAGAPQYVTNIPQLEANQPAYHRPSDGSPIAMFGDSVPYFLVQRIPHKNFPGLNLVNLATPGCDLLDQPMQRGDLLQQNDPDCRTGKKDFEQRLKASHAQTVVIMGSLLVGIPHNVGGKVLWLDSPQYRKLITDKLTEVTKEAHDAGAKKVIVTTVPCRGEAQMQGPMQYLAGETNIPQLMAEATHPVRINTLITGWAKSANVSVVDLAGPICGSSYKPVVHGIPLYDDGIHFSPEATPMIWDWLAPQILAKAGLQ